MIKFWKGGKCNENKLTFSDHILMMDISFFTLYGICLKYESKTEDY